MAVSVGDFVRLTAKMKLFATEDVMNVFTYRVDRNDNANDNQFMDEAALFLDIAYTILEEDISDYLTWVTIDGQNISKSELLPEVGWPTLVAGPNAAALLPTQVAGEVYWPTITPKVRTTAFIGGYTIAANDSDASILLAARTRLASFGDALKEWNTTDVDAVKGSWNPTAFVFTQSGDPVVPARWRTQRRRRVGVGS